jgi:hypothetical protein
MDMNLSKNTSGAQKDSVPVYEYVIMAAIFAAILVGLFWRLRYGYAEMDEAFYPTIAQRFLQGDRILYDEWHVTQLSAVLIMPFLKLFQMTHASSDGVYLYFRYLYTIFKIILSVFIYLRMKKYSRRGAYIASMIVLIFAGYGLMVVSYNTIYIGGGIVAFLLFLNESDTLKSRIYWVLSGVALSVSVIGMPYNALVYIAYLVAVIVVSTVYKKSDKKNRQINETVRLCYSWKAFGFVTIGVAVSLCVFLIYLFSQMSLGQMMSALSSILHSDPSHTAKSLYGLTAAFFVRILIRNDHNYASFCVYVVIAVILLVFIKDKKRNERLAYYVAADGVAALALLVAYMLINGYINYIIIVPNVLAVLLVCMVNDELIRKLFATIVAPGVLVMYGEYLGSNTGFTGISSASCVSVVGSVMIIVLVIQKFFQIYREKTGAFMRQSAAVLSVFLAVTAVWLMYYRMTYVFWEDGGIPSLTEKIENGPAAGLIVTPEAYDKYEQILADTEFIREMPDDTYVLYIGDQCLWMAGGTQRVATYSTLNYCINSTENLYNYYAERPEKIADVVYIYGFEDSKKELADKLVERYGYSVEQVNSGLVLKKLK